MAAIGMMRIGGILIMVVVGTVLFRMLRKEMKQRDANTAGQTTGAGTGK